MPSTKWLLEAAALQQRPSHTTAKPLHILRALLRECTYLPDPASRVYMKEYILSRYKAYQPSKHSRDASNYTRPLLHPRFAKLQTTARKGLSQLRRANAGYIAPLSRVLFMTYGRDGKRRHELLASLHKTEPTTGESGSHDTVTPQLIALKVPAETIEKLPKLSAQFHALLESQRLASLPRLTTRAKLRRFELTIPKTNIWQRAMPQKRIGNMVKRWYGEILSKAMPPLPEEEWVRLGRLVTGEMSWDGPLKRRSRGRGEEDTKAQAEIEEFSMELLQDLGLVKIPPSESLAEGPHNITPRFMRRLWATVFVLCPTMSWDSQRQSWNVKWGTAKASDASITGKRSKNARLLQVFEQEGLAEDKGMPAKRKVV